MQNIRMYFSTQCGAISTHRFQLACACDAHYSTDFDAGE
jgi:hypothetical protein